ncbi:glutamate carboxypeptidase [Advenella kashmirensis WT001]|uniref:Glutamate carboxypeptidase n=1 Tax=Advenella kashmirensis (strain DSM 17095 / LMG 22695 / WT001) TaxID=1036672 RepID=I3UGI2_ADVKW|nr:M20/M25/M40 family metallo-hydrolase [Advenella kashmirensis]AFK64120.1 glutamate carboxypeptidase [Advenella kashmirensis WT001]
MKHKPRPSQSHTTGWQLATGTVLALAAGVVLAAPVAKVHDLAKSEQQAYLDTLRDLVHIESGSRDIEGVTKIAGFVADRLKQLGAETQIIEPADVYRMDDTPEKTGPVVHATIKGSGQSKIMMIAHMDTVYQKGDLKNQPFRVEGDKAYGLGIADDKQGVAAILHVVDMLKKLNYKQFGTVTVVLNSDEEISSPGARALITKFAEDQDAVFSFEGGGKDGGVRLATSGIGAAYLKVQGKSSHAGARPEGGVNSLYELAHQVLQMKDLSRPEEGLKLNWTLAKVGTVRNMIPPEATAQADARALKVQDFDALEKAMQEKIKNKLLPESKVELKFEVRRPPLEASQMSRKLAAHAQGIYKNELELDMSVADKATGGGTDAAFAAVKTRGGVVEGFGLSGFGAHSNNAEYVQIPTIAPRLYLATRMIMDISEGKMTP